MELEFKNGDALFTSDLGRCIVISTFKGSAGSVFVKLRELRGNKEFVKFADKLSEEICDKGRSKFHYPIIFNAPREAYWFTIGFIAKHSVIELRTTPKTQDPVIKDYLEITGCDIDEDYVVYNPNMETFTDNARIIFKKPNIKIYNALYFPTNSKGNTIIETTKNKCGIYNKEFVWTLFSFGFRTGFDHDIDEIKLHLGRQPKEHIIAFNKGFHEKYFRN